MNAETQVESFIGKFDPDNGPNTDIYLFENGVWTLLARQASVVREVAL